MTRVLVIDNYDSFVYTLVGYLQQLGADTHVIRNDEISRDELAALASEFDGVLISPGPGCPQEAGLSMDMIELAVEREIPLLGVCLGHQAIAEAFGGVVSHAPELMHGKTSVVEHSENEFFKDVPQQFQATRYHSLAVEPETMPAELEVTAATDSGIIMALQHKTLPIYGVQYHPESVLTESGYQQIGNWLALIGIPEAAERAKQLRAF